MRVHVLPTLHSEGHFSRQTVRRTAPPSAPQCVCCLNTVPGSLPALQCPIPATVRNSVEPTSGLAEWRGLIIHPS